jgi:hypothetical protein
MHDRAIKIGQLVMGYRSALLVMAVVGPVLDLLDGLGRSRPLRLDRQTV